MTEIKQLDDLDFTVVATSHDYRVEYVVYEIVARDVGTGNRCHPMPDGNSSGNTTTQLSEARVFLHGQVKWDGCSNWHFDEQDHLMLHGCGKEDLTRIGAVLGAMWDWTAELCPNWDGE